MLMVMKTERKSMATHNLAVNHLMVCPKFSSIASGVGVVH